MTVPEPATLVVEPERTGRRTVGRAALAIVASVGMLLLIIRTWEALAPYILGLTIAYLLLPLVRCSSHDFPRKAGSAVRAMRSPQC